MVQELITLKSGKVNDYLHHIDLRGYGTTRMLSVFLGEFDDYSVLFDCGSSLDTKKVLRYFKKNKIPLSSFKYLVTSHHHFDHCGGALKFYEELKRVSKNIILLVPPLWDIASLADIREHKWQFMTLRTKHVNILPNKFKLPYWWYQKRFGQMIRD